MADDLTVNRDGDMLVIRIPIKTPTPSASGKTLVVAWTRGNQKTAVQIDGKDENSPTQSHETTPARAPRAMCAAKEKRLSLRIYDGAQPANADTPVGAQVLLA